MILLFGGQIVRTGGNARLTAADNRSESTQIQLAIVPLKAKPKAERHQNDAQQETADGRTDDQFG